MLSGLAGPHPLDSLRPGSRDGRLPPPRPHSSRLSSLRRSQALRRLPVRCGSQRRHPPSHAYPRSPSRGHHRRLRPE